jgi:hypothetical protein
MFPIPVRGLILKGLGVKQINKTISDAEAGDKHKTLFSQLHNMYKKLPASLPPVATIQL